MQCERQPDAVFNPRDPPPAPVCGSGGAGGGDATCQAGVASPATSAQQPPKEPPPRAAAGGAGWRGPWGGGGLFPDPSPAGCQECADQQLASDLAAARLHSSSVGDSMVFGPPPICFMQHRSVAFFCIQWQLAPAAQQRCPAQPAAAGAGPVVPPQTGTAQAASPREPQGLASEHSGTFAVQARPADTEISWGLLAMAALTAALAVALALRRHLASAARSWRRRPPDATAHTSASQLRSAAASALRDATVSGALTAWPLATAALIVRSSCSC